MLTVIHPSGGDLRRLFEYPDLKDLCLVGDYQTPLSEPGLTAGLAKMELRSLLVHDSALSWRTLEACATHPTLRYLSLSWCEGIGQPMIDALRQARPEVIVVFDELRLPAKEPTVHPDSPIDPTTTKPNR